MTVFIADIYTSGHHLTYIRLFAKLFKQIGYRVFILLPQTSSKEVAVTYFLKNNSIPKIIYFKYKYTQIKGGRIAGRNELINKWHVIAKSIQANQKYVKGPLLVFFPYLDPFLGPYVSVRELDKVFTYRWSGLYMNPPNCRVPLSFGWLRKGLMSYHHLLNSKNCKITFVYDPLCAKLLSKETKTQVIPIPDIIDDSSPNLDFSLSKEIIRKADGRKIISLLGSISKRKGLLNLLQAVPFLTSHFFILIAGKLDISSFNISEIKFIKNVLQSHEDEILFFNERILTESDFNALIATSDVLFAVYQDFYTSSNLISKAAFFKKPILVSKGFLMEDIVNKYQLGLAVESNNTNELIRTLNEMVSNSYVSKYNKENKCTEYCVLFSEKKLCSLLKMLN